MRIIPTRQYLKASVRGADYRSADRSCSTSFDFSGLSADNGGYIYALNVFYAGNVVNNWSEGLWPHAWSYASPFNVGGGRHFFDYQFTAMGTQLTLGTFCHENGHMICDFPDLYDYGQVARGGTLSLMAYGSADPRNPFTLTPISNTRRDGQAALYQSRPGSQGR